MKEILLSWFSSFSQKNFMRTNLSFFSSRNIILTKYDEEPLYFQILLLLLPCQNNFVS